MRKEQRTFPVKERHGAGKGEKDERTQRNGNIIEVQDNPFSCSRHEDTTPDSGAEHESNHGSDKKWMEEFSLIVFPSPTFHALLLVPPFSLLSLTFLP